MFFIKHKGIVGQRSDYKTAILCRQETEGNYCHWDENCQKSVNQGSSPKTIKSDEECTMVNRDCPLSSQGGCQLSGWGCKNQENYDCEQYKSISTTKLNGGCFKNQECTNIMIKETFLLDQQGRKCFCNAPNVHNIPEQCYNYSKLYSIKQALDGCIDITCGVIFQKEKCKVDSLDFVLIRFVKMLEGIIIFLMMLNVKHTQAKCVVKLRFNNNVLPTLIILIANSICRKKECYITQSLIKHMRIVIHIQIIVLQLGMVVHYQLLVIFIKIQIVVDMILITIFVNEIMEYVPIRKY